jgi:hypothetical protein
MADTRSARRRPLGLAARRARVRGRRVGRIEAAGVDLVVERGRFAAGGRGQAGEEE